MQSIQQRHNEVCNQKGSTTILTERKCYLHSKSTYQGKGKGVRATGKGKGTSTSDAKQSKSDNHSTQTTQIHLQTESPPFNYEVHCNIKRIASKEITIDPTENPLANLPGKYNQSNQTYMINATYPDPVYSADPWKLDQDRQSNRSNRSNRSNTSSLAEKTPYVTASGGLHIPHGSTANAQHQYRKIHRATYHRVFTHHHHLDNQYQQRHTQQE